jgi:hypothetical protein
MTMMILIGGGSGSELCYLTGTVRYGISREEGEVKMDHVTTWNHTLFE